MTNGTDDTRSFEDVQEDVESNEKGFFGGRANLAESDGTHRVVIDAGDSKKCSSDSSKYKTHLTTNPLR